ncbi:MAG: RNA polymerase sigma-70 factor [Chloroflexota bacterium]
MDAVSEFNQHRQALFGLAYRMLGSSMDAEDVLQEAFLNWQSAPRDEIHSPKAYLVRIVTRLAIDHLRLARVQREQYVGMWLPEPTTQAVEGDPAHENELAETLSTAFLLVLERLSPVDRAVLLLHEVFSYTYPEIAEIIGRSAVDVRQIGHRARTRVAEDRPRFTTSLEQAEQVTRQFIAACQEGELAKLFDVLSADVILRGDGGGKVNARREPVIGAENVIRFLEQVQERYQSLENQKLVIVNGQLLVIGFHEGQVFNVTTFDFRDGRISAIFSVLNPDKLKGISAAN